MAKTDTVCRRCSDLNRYQKCSTGALWYLFWLVLKSWVKGAEKIQNVVSASSKVEPLHAWVQACLMFVAAAAGDLRLPNMLFAYILLFHMLLHIAATDVFKAIVLGTLKQTYSVWYS